MDVQQRKQATKKTTNVPVQAGGRKIRRNRRRVNEIEIRQKRLEIIRRSSKGRKIGRVTEVDCFKGQMEMREEAQVKAASKKNARLSSASKPRFYSVKRSSETEGHLYRTRLFTLFHSRVFKVFLTSSYAPRTSC